MSGNPMGLAGISHYGTMQRVGGKAAGFINKKFFHPSSLRNQEKLWMAMTAHEVQTKKEDEMEKRRVEERQVEDLRKQMYLSGQATKGSDMVGSGVMQSRGSGAPQHATKDQRLAFEEQSKRRRLLKEQRAAKEDGGDGGEEEEDLELLDESGAQKPEAEMLAGLAKSRYKEDVLIKGHSAVWGSWYDSEVDSQRWGFVCCKSLDRNKRCPLAPELDEEEDGKPAKAERQARGKRRRRGGANAAGDAAAEAPAASSTAGSANGAATSSAPGSADGAPPAAAAAAAAEPATETAVSAEDTAASAAAAFHAALAAARAEASGADGAGAAAAADGV